LNLDQALSFARHIQAQDGRRPGEIAYIGPGRTTEREEGGAEAAPCNLRVLAIADNIANCGLRKIGMRRSASDPDSWEVYVSAHNYGAEAKNVTVSIDFGPPGNAARAPAGVRALSLDAGADAELSFQFRTAAAGVLGVNLTPHDAFPADDHAELELPAQPLLTVTVYSNEPDLLRPALSATTRVTAVYRKPEQYNPNDRGLVILDRFAPPQRPKADSIWIDPPAQGSPIPIRTTVDQAAFQKWDVAHPASAGLRAKDFKLDKASVFEAAADDGRIGEVAAGPVIVARDGKPKVVVFGFHPGLSAMRYELTTPLLFANLLRWISPEIFRRWEISGGSVGNVKVLMDDDTPQNAVKVLGEDGAALPFTLRDRTVNFFAGSPGSVRVLAGDREYVYSLTLPQLWDAKWQLPTDVRAGIPHFAPIVDRSSDLWPWLALLGAAGLLAEWLLYGRFRRQRSATHMLFVRRKARAHAEARR
jgi:hypothetical protein